MFSARGQWVVSRWNWTRAWSAVSKLVSVAQSGAVWSSCPRVSDFYGPHCGPLSCSCLQLNGPFDGPPEAFHRAPCHRARGLKEGTGGGGWGLPHNTWHVWKTMCPNQNKSHSVRRLLEINFLSSSFFLFFFFSAFKRHRMEKNRMIWDSRQTGSGTLWTAQRKQ